jgi:hypothetical protein
MNVKMPPLMDRPYRLQEVNGRKQFVFGDQRLAAK